jgi:hypothetical protein
MKKTYIIPTADVVEIKVNHLLMTSSMELIGDETLVDSGDFLSREVDMGDEDDFDFEDEDEF